MSQYGPEFFRKYADLITEAESAPQPPVNKKNNVANILMSTFGAMTEDEAAKSSWKGKVFGSLIAAAIIGASAFGIANSGPNPDMPDISQEQVQQLIVKGANWDTYNDAAYKLESKVREIKLNGGKYTDSDANRDAIELNSAVINDILKNKKIIEQNVEYINANFNIKIDPKGLGIIHASKPYTELPLGHQGVERFKTTQSGTESDFDRKVGNTYDQPSYNASLDVDQRTGGFRAY